MTQVPYMGVRPIPRQEGAREPWEAFVRSEYPGRDTRWFAAALAPSNGTATANKPSLLARLVLRWEAMEHRLVRSSVPGLASEVTLPARDDPKDSECEGRADLCREALKDRSAIGPR